MTPRTSFCLLDYIWQVIKKNFVLEMVLISYRDLHNIEEHHEEL